MRLIDADALVGWMKGAGSYLKGLENHKPLTKAIGVIINHTEAMPTIDAVEVVHGRWIEKQEPITWCEDDVEVFWECSICECLSFGESPYCPNCGAKMDGERKNDNGNAKRNA